jgi:hypothetical protein
MDLTKCEHSTRATFNHPFARAIPATCFGYDMINDGLHFVDGKIASASQHDLNAHLGV